MKKTLILVGVVVVFSVAYWLISPFWRVQKLDEQLPGLKKVMEAMPPKQKSALILGSAPLVAEAHEVKGRVLVVESGGKKFLRFEDLETINGPDLRVYLSSGLNVDDAIDLGPLRATHGNVNYPLPPESDLTKYRNALIWCRAFRILFSYGKM